MDSSSAPLADYFWIAGIDSLSYGEQTQAAPNYIRDRSPNGAANSPTVDSTIVEGSEDDATELDGVNGARPTARHSRTNSWNRLSRLSNDARLSIQSLDTLELTKSNRSSATIRAVPASSNSGTNGQPHGLSDFDFDRALLKFANERENFLDDLSFSAGVVSQSRPPMTNRAERLRHEESENSGRRSPFGKVGGSIRRRISFRDMNSMKRQQTVSRTSECAFILYSRRPIGEVVQAKILLASHSSDMAIISTIPLYYIVC